MDREKIAAGLAVKYEKLLPYVKPAPGSDTRAKAADPLGGLEFGYAFAEKFVQLPFLAPLTKISKVSWRSSRAGDRPPLRNGRGRADAYYLLGDSYAAWAGRPPIRATQRGGTSNSRLLTRLPG